MKYKFDFNFAAWIKDIEIDADSIDEALDKLYSMSLSEFEEEGTIKNEEITDVDYTVDEVPVKVVIDDFEFEPLSLGRDVEKEKEAVEKVRKQFIGKEITFTLKDEDNLEDLISDYLDMESNVIGDFDKIEYTKIN